MEVGCSFWLSVYSMCLQKGLERVAFVLLMALSVYFVYKPDLVSQIHFLLQSLQHTNVKEVNQQASSLSWTQNMAERKRCIKGEEHRAPPLWPRRPQVNEKCPSEGHLCYSGMSDTPVTVTTFCTCKALPIKKRKTCPQRLHSTSSSFTSTFHLGSNPIIQEI